MQRCFIHDERLLAILDKRYRAVKRSPGMSKEQRGLEIQRIRQARSGHTKATLEILASECKDLNPRDGMALKHLMRQLTIH